MGHLDKKMGRAGDKFPPIIVAKRWQLLEKFFHGLFSHDLFLFKKYFHDFWSISLIEIEYFMLRK